MIYVRPQFGRTVAFDERQIEAMEETGENGETRLLLRSGEMKVVEETAAEIVDRIVAARRRRLHDLPPVIPRPIG